MDKNEILKSLIKLGIVRVTTTSHIMWAGNVKAPVYVEDQKIPSKSVELYNEIVNAMAGIVKELISNDDVMLASASSGALQWTAMVARQLGLKYVHVRSEIKDHGSHNLIEGDVPRGCKFIIFDDVIATAMSSVSAKAAVEAQGGKVTGVVAIFNYELPTTLTLHHIPVCSILTFSDLLEALPEDQRTLLQEWHRDPNEWNRKGNIYDD